MEASGAEKYRANIDLKNLNNSHTQIINKVADGARVLDVGCASGDTGEYLVENKKCEVIGLDSDDEALARAADKGCYNKLVKVDLDHVDFLELELPRFDCILMGDVIEHVKAPESLICKMKKLLNEQGVFIISLPNVAHGSIKLKLLKNQFEYTEMGLLDRTHIGLFTLNSIIDFCKSSGLAINNFNRVMRSIYQTEQELDRSAYKNSVLRIVESDIESWVYQYIFSATPSDKANQIENLDKMKPSDEELKMFKKLKRKYRWKI